MHTLIIHIVTSKLDPSTDRESVMKVIRTLPKTGKLKLSQLIKFLTDRANFLESSDSHTKKQSVTKSHSHVITHKYNNKKKSSQSPRHKRAQCGTL